MEQPTIYPRGIPGRHRLGVLLILAPLVLGAVKPGEPPLVIEVVLANDPDLPPVREGDAKRILAAAAETLADKLGAAELRFDIKGSHSVADFMARNESTECLKQLEPLRVRPGGRQPKEVPAALVDKFLRRWSVEALQAFFPESQRAKLTDYEAIAAALSHEFEGKLATLSQFKIDADSYLLSPDRLDERSYVRWVCAVRAQDEADLILTNAFILYDLGSEPYPHSIFAKNKVGGASLSSPKRQVIRGRAVVASTFSMVTDLDFFQEEGVETLGPQQRLDVIGTFIVAHELGHALFRIPDFYDHPKECLMTTKYETGYVSGYREIKQFPGLCTGCQPYVAAKRRVFEAQRHQRVGQWAASAASFKEAIRLTPKHIDGSYLGYVAGLSVDVAEMYWLQGNERQAARWLNSARRVAPNLDSIGALEARMRGETAAGGQLAAPPFDSPKSGVLAEP